MERTKYLQQEKVPGDGLGAKATRGKVQGEQGELKWSPNSSSLERANGLESVTSGVKLHLTRASQAPKRDKVQDMGM